MPSPSATMAKPVAVGRSQAPPARVLAALSSAALTSMLPSSGVAERRGGGGGTDVLDGAMLQPGRIGRLPVPVRPDELGMEGRVPTVDVYALICAFTSSRVAAKRSFISRAMSRSEAVSLRPRRYCFEVHAHLVGGRVPVVPVAPDRFERDRVERG